MRADSSLKNYADVYIKILIIKKKLSKSTILFDCMIVPCTQCVVDGTFVRLAGEAFDLVTLFCISFFLFFTFFRSNQFNFILL